MKTLNVHGISIQFDKDTKTKLSNKEQVQVIVDHINVLLQRDPDCAGAQVIFNATDADVIEGNSEEEI